MMILGCNLETVGEKLPPFDSVRVSRKTHSRGIEG